LAVDVRKRARLICIGLAAVGSTAGLLAQSPLPQQPPKLHPEQWPRTHWPLKQIATDEAKICALLARMTVEQKVGQVIQADIASVTPDEVRRYHIGSVLNGGNSAPGNDEFAAPDKWLALADAYHNASRDTRDGNAGIPVIWGTDAVHGHSNIVGATLFPHNIGLGAAHDPDLIERIGRATAVEVRATGIDWTFAPTLTVPQDYRWGRAYEGYSSDPGLVTAYARRMIIGLQGKPGAERILAGPHVLASTKHFIADGGTEEGRDQGDARIDETTLRKIHGAPYVAAIDVGVGTIMSSFSSWQGAKIAGNKELLTDVLKRRMNFGGFVVTDWNAHGQIAGCTNASCPAALNAGVDMYMAPDSWKSLYESLVKQVRDGTVPMARLDDAVARVLRTKLRLGVFESGKPSSRPLAGKFSLIGNPAHRAIAREAVRKSLVLLKNSADTLPVSAASNILVAGDGANDIGRQSGGWTITWQGTGVSNKDFPGATSIWGGIEASVRRGDGTATLSPDGSFVRKPDVAIVVFGETPYAEFQGDLKTLQLAPELRKPYATMQRLKSQGIPVVAVMLTGRPLFVNPELNVADAFVVAWLPGSEGGGIADVLFQDKERPAHAFSGTLPASWPATALQSGPVLFARGYGLKKYGKPAKWIPLDENPGVADVAVPGVYFDKGAPTPSWSLIVGDGTGGSETRITTLPALANSGQGKVSATNYLVQEGANLFEFSGGDASVVLTTHAPIDLSRETNGDVALLMTIRLDQKPETPPSLGMRSANMLAHRIVFPELTALPQGVWTTIAVPLRCFAKAGADMGQIRTPFELTTRGKATFALARVALGTVADRTLTCAR
jgi:beta-glucosidase